MATAATPLLNPNDEVETRLTLKLLRLQVATPLSVLLNVAVFLTCWLLVSPSMTDLSKAFPTVVTPHAGMISVLWLLIYIGQIGFCVLLVLGRMHSTKQLLAYGVGFRLLVANWIMIIWSIAYTLKYFTPAAVVLSVLFLLILWINISLLWYPTHANHPLDTLFIHVPLRLWFLILLLVILPQNIFIAADWFYSPDHPEREYTDRAMEGFVSVVATNIIGLLWVAFRRDLWWTIAGVYVMIAFISKRPKPTIVFVALIIFAVLYPLFWIAASTYHRVHEQHEAHKAAQKQRQEIDSAQAGSRAADLESGQAPPVAAPAPVNNGAPLLDEDEEDPAAVWGQPQSRR